MQKKQVIFSISMLLLGLFAGRYLIPSNTAAPHAVDMLESTQSKLWTCSMHPQIRQAEPGDCPICGMELVPAVEGSDADLGARELSMSESSRALAEIEVTAVRRDFPRAQIRLVGQLDYDETREKSLTARFPARIERLFVNFTGVRVERGEHLAEVYSPELLSAQRELISAHQRDPHSSITAAAREKLRLWDLLPDQIDSILASGEGKDRFELRAPIGGVVVMKKVNEGAYVKTGEPLFKIVDLSELWLYLDAYESDLFWLRYGQRVDFTVESYPGETFTGRIAFIEPELNRTTRTVPIRVNVDNQDGRLKPGMFARGVVESSITEDGQIYAPDLAQKWVSPMHPEIVKNQAGSCDVCGMPLVPAEELGYVAKSDATAPLLVPSSAVLRTGKRAVVYVALPDKERPTYEGREIVLGPKAGDQFIVKSGLNVGELVVTKGAFKIDSALQIRAKPSMMQPPAASRISPHTEHSAQLRAAVEVPAEWIGPYLDLQAALAADDLAASKASLRRMMAVPGQVGSLAEWLHELMSAESLEAIRRPHFETLSKLMIETVQAQPHAFKQKLFRMHCSMAYPDRGADWIQADEELLNPYFGARMLRCGEVKAILNQPRQAQPPQK
jgi:Cu(I)/Ag(I) efflux system membrane fusion protein